MDICCFDDIPLWSLILIVLVVAYILYMTWRFNDLKQMGVKGPRLWELFSILGMGVMKADVMLMKKYGKVWGVQEFRDPNLYVADEEMLRELLVKKFADFQNRRTMDGFNGDLEYGLTVLKGQHWKEVRNLMTPTFSAGKLKQMTPLIKKASDSLMESLAKKCSESKEMNVKRVFGSYTMDVICSTAFGIDVDSQNNPNDPYVRSASKLMDFKLASPVFLMLFFTPFLLKPLGKIFGVSFFPKAPQAFFRGAVVKEINNRRSEREDYVDFMQMMIQAHDESPDSTRKGMNTNEIIANSILFFFAGYETTATTLSLLSHNLALYPDTQERLVEEIRRELGDDSPDYDNVNKLEYLDMCINETLRLFPPAARTDRVASRDTELGGLKIPKGVAVTIPIWAIHHSPDIWDDPETFDPQRFSSENKSKISPFHFLPFGYGPRVCIGMRLAMLELKIAYVSVIRKYKFSFGKKSVNPPKLVTTGLISPKELWLDVEER